MYGALLVLFVCEPNKVNMAATCQSTVRSSQVTKAEIPSTFSIGELIFNNNS